MLGFWWCGGGGEIGDGGLGERDYLVEFILQLEEFGVAGVGLEA